MPYTMQDAVDRGRKPLKDTDKIRYSDTDLLVFAIDFVLACRKRRPDLFVGQYAALPAPATLGATFPVPDEYLPVAADYITARAEMVDDEFANDGRAAGFLQLFERGLIGP